MGAILWLFRGLKWNRPGIVSAVYTFIAGGLDVAGGEDRRRLSTSEIFASLDMRSPTDGQPGIIGVKQRKNVHTQWEKSYLLDALFG